MKLTLLGALAALAVMPALAQAAPSTAVETALFKRGEYAPLRTPAPLKGAQRVHWYYDYNGVAWSNVCQTPNFWVNFGRRYYVVGSGCIAQYNGVQATGIMVAR